MKSVNATLQQSMNHSALSFGDIARTAWSLPARYLARLRALDGIANSVEIARAQQHEDGHTGLGPDINSVITLPGPLSFFTGRYAVVLFIMALILNRIQNIVVPPRRGTAHHLRPLNSQSILLTLLHALFPLHLTSTFTRFCIRFPSLYLLAKSLLLMSTILAQTSGLFPTWEWLSPLGEWAAKKEMADACWLAFISVCAALVVGSLTRGLEGSGAGTTHFNLFGYAFLLHIYSSPIAHHPKTSDLPSRPDKHVLVTIVLPLLQLTMLHVMGIKKAWSKQRLIPTTICGVLNLIHFHYVFLFSPTPYPLLNLLPSLLESFLLHITILTASLHALTQILLEGHISRPIFGHARSLPSREEDFTVALLRLGTASIEATSVAGLGNEVGGIEVGGDSVELGPGGVLGMSHTGRQHGFSKEYKNVKVKAAEPEAWIDTTWLRELVRFGKSLFTFAKGFRRLIWRRGSLPRIESDPSAPTTPPTDVVNEEDPRDELYERFLRGDVDSDDEGEYAAPDVARHDSASSECSSEEDEDDGSEGNEPEDASELFADLSNAELAPSTVLLAHLTTNSPSPLTRRRYSQMVRQPQDDTEGWAAFTRQRQPGSAVAERVSDESRRMCVICTVEERVIICWPCRCLALCDECRANLASRSSAHKHSCPCCRQNVEGYSRIFIP